MINPFDRKQFAPQPAYHTKPKKFEARAAVVAAYRKITGHYAIPPHLGYWTLCAKQPNTDGAEIMQLVNCGLLQKSQFFGIDRDLKEEGIIEHNRQCHSEAHWFQGDLVEVIEENYDDFHPALLYADYTHAVVTKRAHLYLARTLNLCPSGTVVAANLMLSDGHSSRRFSPELVVENLDIHLRSPNDWSMGDACYIYKASHTEMGTYIFVRS